MHAGCSVLPEGFPFLLSEKTGEVEHLPTSYLARCCLPGGFGEVLIVSKLTALKVAYDLKDFAEYLHAANIEYSAINLQTLYSYAGTMANRISPYTQETYSHLTIGKRTTLAVSFSTWLGKRGIISPQALTEILTMSRRGEYSEHPVRHRARVRGAIRPTLLPTAYKLHDPHILNDEDARALLRALKGSSEPGGDNITKNAVLARNALMAKLCLCGGLRREEVCKLERSSIASIVITGRDTGRLHAVPLTHTKNNVKRKVLLAGSLIQELQNFCDTHREALCARGCKGRCGLGGPIFPAAGADRKKRCAPMSAQNFGLIVRCAAKACGLTAIATKRDSKGNVIRQATVPAMSVHDLRHTYAVWTYLLLRKQGDTNPWLFIQAQLGHRSSETTINTYLRAVRMLENELTDAYASYLEALTTLLEE